MVDNGQRVIATNGITGDAIVGDVIDIILDRQTGHVYWYVIEDDNGNQHEAIPAVVRAL
jgi:hypothetical protein